MHFELVAATRFSGLYSSPHLIRPPNDMLDPVHYQNYFANLFMIKLLRQQKFTEERKKRGGLDFVLEMLTLKFC